MRAIAAILLALAAGAQDDRLAPEVLLLARIKVHMSENLSRLPNYTCVQTIERSTRPAKTGKYRLIDTLRLEVALVNGRELFAWPGAGRFEDRELRDMVGGTSGTGAFGLHAKAIFLTSGPVFTYRGETVRQARKAVQYDFRVARLTSGYKMRVGEQEGMVGYHGSFLVDAVSLDLLRLELEADDIPPNLSLSAAGDQIEYQRTRIGENDFLLPQTSVLWLTDLAGNESRNRTTYQGCRQYTGESVLTFSDPPPDAPVPAPPPPAQPADVPAGSTLELELTGPIEPGAPVGEPVAARLYRDVRQEGKVIVPRGAVVHGRLSRHEQYNRSDTTLVGITFDRIEFDGRRSDLKARLVELRSPRSPASPVIISGGARNQAGWGRAYGIPALEARPGEGLLLFRGKTARVPKGFVMTWAAE